MKKSPFGNPEEDFLLYISEWIIRNNNLNIIIKDKIINIMKFHVLYFKYINKLAITISSFTLF